ncbi:hypothetical protein HU200_033588 [Digitaria exilis]|uniref:Uncharacterized protein n=1 Tax=Digitaria exilis TaxID=1010633 RepID=A0A835EKL3_9POAL|nr:hypothetical protein HU200_033588 [Digitaria exilis]
MECTIARLFWEQKKVETGVKLPKLTWRSDMLFLGTKKEQVVIICGMWSLWILCNKRRHGEPRISIRQIVLWIRHNALDLWQILHPVKHPKPVVEQQRWTRLVEGLIKWRA